MRRAFLTMALVLPLLIAQLPPPGHAGAVEDAVAHGLAFLRGRQQADGSIDGSVMLTPWAITSVVGAGEDPGAWRISASSPSLLDALASQYALQDPAKPTDWARGILAIAAAGEDPRRFGGNDWLLQLRAHHVNGQTGQPGYVNDDLFALLALRAAGIPPDDTQVQDAEAVLRNAQYTDGSWGWSTRDPGPTGHSPDLTGMAICALTEAGAPPSDPAIVLALEFLDAVQTDDGGFPMSPSGSTGNVWSTSWALHGLHCAGEDPHGARWTPAGPGPVDFLAARAPNETDTWAIVEIVRALAYPGFPVRPPLPQVALAASANPAPHGTPVGLDASGSLDPWGKPLTYRWDFGDGTGTGWSSAARVEHRFAAPGTYPVKVEARTEAGAVASATILLEALNLAPGLTVLSDVLGDRVTAPPWADAVVAADGNGDPLAWAWELGDGNTSTDPTPDHRYERLGNYLVNVTVDDGHGGVARASFNVSIRNLPPSLTLDLPPLLRGGHEYTFAAASADPDGATLAYAWELGDGNISSSASPAHAYLLSGEYTVNVTVTDADGAQAAATQVVVVDAVTPSTTATPDRDPDVGDWHVARVTLTLSVADEGPGTTMTLYRVDDGIFRRYVEPFEVEGNGEVRITYWSRDAAGNVEDKKNLSLALDTSPPAVRLRAGASTLNAPRVIADAGDAGSGVARVEFHVDGRLQAVDGDGQDGWGFTPDSSAMGAGPHALRAVAFDHVGRNATDEAHLLVLPAGGFLVLDGPDLPQRRVPEIRNTYLDRILEDLWASIP